ncbi:MAG TPA: 23S rRNA (guanosine(2251)-2'-O)-methyltransferase RlmB [Chloroflexota bacterium]|nr:23S rRNA (guanosine(2251)-2'-O)-methyltransferase RlmB [Chloroflexota bacterium]
MSPDRIRTDRQRQRRPRPRPRRDAYGPASRAREEADESLRWGAHAVEEALRAGSVRRLLLQDDAAGRQRLRALAQLARETGTPLTFAPATLLSERAGTDRHQGAVAETVPFRYTPLSDLLRAAGVNEPPLLLVLDGVQDPQNLGAILRSADGAGAHGVLLPERRAAGITAAVARASAGAADHVPVARVVNLPRALDELKGAGVWVYGLDAVDAAGSVPFDQADYARPLALVAGAEGKGLSRLVRERCDLLLRIPLQGRVASLNVSVAASLALFAARTARTARTARAERSRAAGLSGARA